MNVVSIFENIEAPNVSTVKTENKMHNIFSKHGSTSKLPRPRPTDTAYVINNRYATFQSLILITSTKIFNLS